MIPNSATPGIPQAQVAGAPSEKSHSLFKPDYKTLSTLRFGEYTPHLFMELVPGDKDVTVRSSHSLRSLPLQSPLFNNVKMHKAYFNVPLQAIIPKNYEKWKDNPVQGQDVPADCGTTVTDFIVKVQNFIDFFFNNSSLAGVNIVNGTILDFFRYLALLSYFGSEGSLLASAEIQIANYFKHPSVDGLTPDKCVDTLMTELVMMYENIIHDGESLFTWHVGSQIYDVWTPDEFTKHDLTSQDITLREFFMRFLEQPLGTFTQNRVTPWSPVNEFMTQLTTDNFDMYVTPFILYYSNPVPVDLRRLHAYNISIAHFLSNDHVDYIYTAELYRQNMWALYISNPNNTQFFTWNGVNYLYDSLSGKCVSEIFSGSMTYIDPSFSFISNIFSFKRSLRFIDYFTGSRAQPLAVGVTDVQVSGSQVSVIDITRGIQRQRFLNAVNRSGAKFESYIKSLFGVKPAYDFHNPMYLGATEDDVFHEEIENTSTDMSSNDAFVRSNLKSNASRYALNFDADRDSVVVGLTYFDIPRFHPFGIPRIVQHVDRFDDFIPQAQFIGDQDINRAELGDNAGGSVPFSYTDRYQEYKLRKSYCFGGVRDYLRTWSYLFDKSFVQTNINPDFIRSLQTEFDKFYTQLTNYSLGGYFHFIVFTDNEISAVRPMVKHPTIL